MTRKILLSSIFALIVLAASSKVLHASEGLVDLTNRINTDARCSVMSVLEQDLNYHMEFSCRDITYPGGVEVINYILWATPVSGGSPIRIGEIGLGKGHFTTREAFNTLYVTVEQNRGARTPSGQIVMQGAVKPIQNLESKFTPRPTATSAATQTTEVVPTITPTPSAKPNGIAKFLTGGIVAFIGLFAVIFILFVVTRR